jgi:hypothetical protein
MIVLPDEDELPVGLQVDALIGKALRHSVAGAEAGAGFAARLAAALDAAAGAEGRAAGGAPGPAGEAGQGTEAFEAAS